MRGFLTAYVRGKGKTLKYEFAVAAFAVWVAYTIRIGISGNAEWITAQATVYGTMTTSVFLYIAAAVGLQAWQNQQGPTSPSSTDPGYIDGAPEPREPSPEDAARKVM